MAQSNFFKVTMFFGDGRYGWSETYYTPILGSPKVPGGVVDPLLALPEAIQLAQARAAMLPTKACQLGVGNYGFQGSIPTLEYVRISQTGFPRNTAFWDPQSGILIQAPGKPAITLPTGPITNLLDTVPADNPYSCIEMECTLSNGLTTRRALGGVPDIAICDQTWSKYGGWYELWQQFATILLNGAWGVASNSILSNAVNVSGASKITDVEQVDAYGRPTIIVGIPLVFGLTANGCPDYRVQIFCYRSQPGGRYPNLNGVYRVILPPGTATQPPGTRMLLSRSMKPLVPWDFGQVIPYPGSTFVAFTSATLTRTIGKKRGRPFGLPVGRSAVIR